MKIRIVVLFLFSGFILSFCGVFDPTNYDPQKSPPTGTIEQRHAWGKKHLGITYQQTIDWVKQAKIVKEQIGNVISVAPLGMPNYVESTFTDGLVGDHTVEIIGDKGSAIFSAKGVAPYETQDNICFSEGILTTKHNRIEVHCSGSTMAEFNRAKRKQLSDRYKMANLNQKIDLSSSKKQKYNADDYKLWEERAKLYADNGDFFKAISDLETVIALLSKSATTEVVNVGKDEKQRWKEDVDRKIENYLYQLALYYFNVKQFDKSAYTIENILKNPVLKKYKKPLNQDNLWLWVSRARSGQKDLADRELKQSLQLAIQKKDFCWTSFANLLLGELSEEIFLEQMETENSIPKECNYIYDRKLFFTYYYLSHKQIVAGNLEKGRELLLKSFDNYASGTSPRREYFLATSELNKTNK
ncbi:MAG: hypothetical protein ACRC11_09180 [Xenococcaceae cyanobacterium]